MLPAVTDAEPAPSARAPVCVGNVWVLRVAQPNAWIVVPTNLGWTRHGANVMGRGLARQAAQRFPGLPGIYGDFLHTAWRGGALHPTTSAHGLFQYTPGQLILFPVKPLNVANPGLSWQTPADVDMIRDGVLFFATWLRSHPEHAPLFVPLLGAGNGQLDPNVALGLLEPLRSFPRVRVVVHPTQAHALPGVESSDHGR